MKVSVSILSNSIKPSDIVKEVSKSKADYIHLDIMDGKFVKNKTWTYSEIKKIVSNTNMKFDVHLMVDKPEKYIEDYALINTEYLIFHYEAVKDIDKIIDKIKSYGLLVGISIKPNTKVEDLYPYLDKIDQVLIMSVEPGESYQTFMHESLEKIRTLKEYIFKNNYKTIISVDGGINEETSLLAGEAGADMLVSASYIHKDIINNIEFLKNL